MFGGFRAEWGVGVVREISCYLNIRFFSNCVILGANYILDIPLPPLALFRKRNSIHFAIDHVLTCYTDVNFMNHPSTVFVNSI